MKKGIFHILVGIDFSDSSAVAIYHAISLAERLDAVLHLCHISPHKFHIHAPTDLGMNIPAEFTEAQQARKRLERMRSMIGGNINVELHLRIGEAVRGLLEVAREIQANMIVLGSHGYGAVLGAIMGSVSKKLVQVSPVPVLIVPAPRCDELADAPTAPIVEPPPSVGSGPEAGLDVSRTNDASSGSINLSPAGIGSYDVNPELRVRY